jgi:putative endonuclease
VRPVNKRKLGGCYEEKAAAFLTEKGLVIEERNYRCPLGEIDLIARDGPVFIFCEVKYRRDRRAGDPAEAVDGHKQQVIFRVASWYMRQRGLAEDTPCRFDVVAITGEEDSCRLRWVQNAFGGW